MDNLLTELEKKLQNSVDHCHTELTQIRTGKASPALVENIMVDAYGGTAKLKILELATIATEGAAGLTITPFDNTTLPDIQKALSNSPLGLSSSVQGPLIRVSVPPLSQEQRNNFVKLLGQKVEESKEQLRVSRDEVRRHTKSEFEAKNLSEDERRALEKKIDELVKKYTDALEEMRKRKQNEIMSL